MKAAFILPCRNKEQHVGRCVTSILNQTYSPMELIFSDQGSTDNTLAVIKKTCETYDGPNTVRIVECPDTEPTGMSGMNAHCNWLNQQTDADIIIAGSCDDINHPKRAERVVEAFEEFNPSTVHVGIDFITPDGDRVGITKFPLESRFVTGKETILQAVGGSSAMAWSREFYERVGGCHGIVCHDVYLPYLAAQDRGMYYLHELLYAYIMHADPKNLGLEGRWRAAKTEEEQMQLNELMQYQIIYTLRAAAIKAEELYPSWDTSEDKNALLSMIAMRAIAWADLRDQMNDRKVLPILL